MPEFQYIPDFSNSFLKLFPHRLDFIYAEHAAPGQTPKWKTEGRFPLADRRIHEGRFLHGVSFGSHTGYFMLDIDAGSIYHPKRDRFAIGRMLDALEPIGVTDFIAVTSSYSGGVHLYFPLTEPVLTWQIAEVVQQLFQFKGLMVEPGLLEIFPNVRRYDSEVGSYSKFKAHRLPLQEGSYILTEDWQLQRSTPEQFCKLWEFCRYRNELNQGGFEAALKVAGRNYSKLGYKGEKFLTDLNTEIDPGWTGPGQTNYLLGRITLRAYVFGHRLYGEPPLKGDRLVQEIVRTATRLPGYEEWCRHKHEIWQRAEEWARCAENSRYYPYGQTPYRKEPPTEPAYVGWNEWRHRQTIERLCFAIADLLNQGEWPFTITARFEVLTREYGFSGETLYKQEFLEFWHPHFIRGVEPVENPPHPPNSFEGNRGELLLESIPPHMPKSLLSPTGRKPNQGNDQEWFKGWDFELMGRNVSPDKGSSHLDPNLEGGDSDGG